jgi:hypothetical protein
MRTARHLMRWLVTLSMMLVALGAAPAVPAAHAASSDWTAWHIKVDFPPPAPGQSRAPRVIYTTYEGRYNSVAKSVELRNIVQSDISSSCQFAGLTYDSENYAVFNGVSSYIRCPLPPKVGFQSCTNGSFWVAADVKLTAAKLSNPILEGAANKNREFGLSMPVGTGGLATTRFQINGASYQSPAWAVNTGAGGNQAMLASHGGLLVKLFDALHANNIFWLEFMDNWQGFYDSIDPLQHTGHLVQSPSVFTSSSDSFHQWSNTTRLNIGYSPTTGQYLNGSIAGIEIDPPGCFAG